MTTPSPRTAKIVRGHFTTTGLTAIKQRLNLMAINAMRFRADLWSVYHAATPYTNTINNARLLSDCADFKILIDDSADEIYNMLRLRFISETANRRLWGRAEAISDCAFDMYQHIYTAFTPHSTAAQRNEALLAAISCFNKIIPVEPIEICIHDRRLVNLLAQASG